MRGRGSQKKIKNTGVKIMKYFVPTPTTAEELKTAYRNLAKKHHPDKGGSDKEMQAVNAEYDRLFAKLKDVHRNKDGETYTRETAETAEHFKNIIDKLMNMDDILIEIIGCFVWVTGATKPYKDILKSLRFKWHVKKSAWYLAPEDYRRRSRRDYELDEIREMYGTSGTMNSRGTTKIEKVAI
jgi:curved DNA-binding protein CbpA